jgi:metal-responsive CopG/Arc/MetJ family transcriptional regulator
MKTIKTAISIDASTFRSVGRLTRKLHISRSRFFTQAAQYMVEKDENLELIKKINAAYRIDDEDLKRNRHEKAYTKKKTIEKW